MSPSEGSPREERRKPAEDPRASGGTSAFKATWLESWGHFEDLTLVAEGGMGRIFKALDKRLQRRVALKLLRRDDPELASRFLREASIQAQVEHPHVCRIYEAGEWMGQAFIAMQLIDGETLKVAARRMTMEDKLDVMVQVCEGVHAAHLQGLIHRDLKPSNLMVRMVEGSWRAYVLDFGLARTLAATGKTQSGVVMGTVHYMSPEQARGEDRGLDRRTDVYALGATLYELVGGEPPFSEYQGLEALSRLLAEDPVPLRRMAPQIPRDLETVVMKCLERNRERRYANARELAGELRCVLDGEPVEARRASWPERALRWSRKNRLGMAAGAGILLVLGAAGMLLARDRMEARRRGILVAHMGTVAERLENRVRLMRLGGGTARGWAELQEELRDLHRRAGQGDEGAPAARYGYGRLLLALGFEEEGCAQLERAWEAGVRGRAVAWSLGGALMARLRLTRELSRRLPCEEAGEAWFQSEEGSLRPRAAALLREGLGSGPEPMDYQEALLASVEGHGGEALRRARAAFEAQPWLVEAKLLEGDLLQESARGRLDGPASLAQLEEAGRAFEAAAAAAPEDVRPLLRASRCWGRAAVQARAQGRPDEGLIARARQSLDRAHALPSGAPLADLEEAWAGLGDGSSPESMERAERLAERLSVERPEWREAAVGAIQAQLARAEAGSVEPAAHYAGAITAARRLLERAPGHPFGVYLLEDGLTRRAVLHMARDAGGGREALREIRDAQARGPQRAFHFVFEGRILVARAAAEWEQGRDPLPSATGATAALARALALAPRNARVYGDLAQAYLLQGRYEGWMGLEAEAHLAEARRAAFRAQELAPGDPGPCLLLGEAALVACELSKARGRDPAPWLAEVRRWAARLRELSPHGHGAGLLEARAELADPKATSRSLARAIQALSREPGDREVQLLRARLALAQRHWGEALNQARLAARIGPTLGDARWVEALALQGQAESLPEGRRRADLLAQAQVAREQALALNARLAGREQ